MAITLVQSASSGGIASSSATGTVTLGSNVTAGNCVIAVITTWFAAGNSISTVKLGSSTDNWAQAASSASVLGAAIWVDPGSAGGSKTVNVTLSAAGNANTWQIDAYEVSGLAASSVVDKTSTGHASGASGWNSGTTATTATANEFWIGAAAYSGSVSGGHAGWTDGPSTTWISAYQIVSSTGTASYTGTTTSSAPGYDAAVVTLKSALILALPVAQETITALAPSLPGNLAVAIASTAGTDSYGNAFGAGLTGMIAAFQPAPSPTVVETWHNVSPPANLSGTLRYRLRPDNTVEVEAQLAVAAAAASGTLTLIASLGSYTPATLTRGPCGYFTNGPTTVAQLAGCANMRWSANTAGTFTVQAFPGGASGSGITELDISARYPLD